MVLAPVFDAFIQQRPVCVMARAVLERLLDPARIDALFERSAVQGFTRELLFSSLVKLLGDVVLGVRPSVHAAFQSAEADGGVGVSLTAVYNKLDRVEPVVSAALVRDSAQQAGAVIDALGARLPAWLPGYRCRILDGNAPAAIIFKLQATPADDTGTGRAK